MIRFPYRIAGSFPLTNGKFHQIPSDSKAAYPLSAELLNQVHSQLSSSASDETLKLIAVAAGKGQSRDTGQLMTLVATCWQVGCL